MSGYFPVALDIRGRRCLVVGGGRVAARKVESLLEAGAEVVLVAPRVDPVLAEMRERTGFEVQWRAFQPMDLDDVFLVVTATDDPGVNAQVAAEARARRVLVNAVDDAANCDFILPAVVRRGEVQIAITTGGRSPALARHLREMLDDLVPPEYAALADVLASVRSGLRRDGLRVDPEAWQQAIDQETLARVRHGDLSGAAELLRERLKSKAHSALRNRRSSVRTAHSAFRNPPGRIVLVGAGPGDPGLLTLAGRQALADADVVVYDRLVNPELLEYARPHTRRVYVGKHQGEAYIPQGEINDLLCAEALAGNTVVRLKGGDPFVFGRGGEEALAAVRAGVPFSVVPGVTSAVAVPAYAGIPVSHRGLASAFTVVTGHEDPAKGTEDVDWEALARVGGTLVLLMGLHTLPSIRDQLLAAGLDPDTPAAVIQCGTTRAQRVVRATLGTIPELVREAGIQAPATTVVGEVVRLADEINWFPSRHSPQRAGPRVFPENDIPG